MCGMSEGKLLEGVVVLGMYDIYYWMDGWMDTLDVLVYNV